jgi:hypothetical protein
MSSYDRARRQQVDPNTAAEQPSPDHLGRCTVCALMIPLRDNGEIETHYRNIGQCRGTGQLPDLRTDLERAEGWWRGYVAPGSTETHLGVLLAEFDRLRLVEQAATALVEEWEAIRNPADKLVWTIAEQLTERLAAAVHGETP